MKLRNTKEGASSYVRATLKQLWRVLILSSLLQLKKRPPKSTPHFLNSIF